MSGDLPLNINIKEPRWDQGTFMGRAQHFFMVTDPRNVLLSSEVLEDARSNRCQSHPKWHWSVMLVEILKTKIAMF
uniref:Sideroflexin 2 n=1 Tax=Sinocyclocheilus rhinocerous TaxID=307959 RepID=A0A673J3A5_9TELE